VLVGVINKKVNTHTHITSLFRSTLYLIQKKKLLYLTTANFEKNFKINYLLSINLLFVECYCHKAKGELPLRKP
jgi:hypothetical protein